MGLNQSRKTFGTWNNDPSGRLSLSSTWKQQRVLVPYDGVKDACTLNRTYVTVSYCVLNDDRKLTHTISIRALHFAQNRRY